MDKYHLLQQYRFDTMKDVEANLSEETPHFFIRQNIDVLKSEIEGLQNELQITIPQDLIDFWKNVGVGQFYAEPPDEYAGCYQIMSVKRILGVYFAEADKQHSYNTIRADAKNFLVEYDLLAFCEFDEYSALYIALHPDSTGQYAVFSAPTIKIATSLEEFVGKLLEEPDYFLESDDFDE